MGTKCYCFPGKIPIVCIKIPLQYTLASNKVQTTVNFLRVFNKQLILYQWKFLIMHPDFL